MFTFFWSSEIILSPSTNEIFPQDMLLSDNMVSPFSGIV